MFIKVFKIIGCYFLFSISTLFIMIFILTLSGKYSHHSSEPAMLIFFISTFFSIIISIIGIIVYVLLKNKNKKAFKYAFVFTILISVLICIFFTISYGLPIYGWDYNKEYSILVSRSGYEGPWWDNKVFINNKNEFRGYILSEAWHEGGRSGVFFPIFFNYQENVSGLVKDGKLFAERDNGEFWRIYPSYYSCKTKLKDNYIIAYDCAGGYQELSDCEEFVLYDGSASYPWSCKPLNLEDYNLKVGDNVVLLKNYGYPSFSDCAVCFEKLEKVEIINK